jgi:hypothetical protein
MNQIVPELEEQVLKLKEKKKTKIEKLGVSVRNH